MKNYFLTIITMFMIFSCSDENKNSGGGEIPWLDSNPSGIIPGDISYENEFFVDPVNGDDQNDGSFENPWKNIQYVVENYVSTFSYESLPPDNNTLLVEKNESAPVKAGDVIVLMAGNHGSLEITQANNQNFITIKAMDGETAIIDYLLISGSTYWNIEGLLITPEFSVEPLESNLVTIENHNWVGSSHHIYIHDNTIQNVENSSAWTITDWNENCANGVYISADYVRFENNLVKNINFGISVTGTFNDIIGNVVENFAGDGLRGLGNDCLFEFNTVKNCYDVNENHDDGFQSWAIGGVSPKRIVLRSNTIINYEDATQQFIGSLQGIGCFDGFYEDWIVENNLIIVDHWHGITFLGAKNVIIRNNTVVNRDPTHEADPWINIGAHKDDRSSSNCVIRNNIAVNSIQASGDTLDSSNLLVGDDELELWFVNPSTFDYHLNVDSPALNTGSEIDPPLEDHDGTKRPQSSNIDIGCYEQ
jgi:hypothetical protein